MPKHNPAPAYSSTGLLTAAKQPSALHSLKDLIDNFKQLTHDELTATLQPRDPRGRWITLETWRRAAEYARLRHKAVADDTSLVVQRWRDWVDENPYAQPPQSDEGRSYGQQIANAEERLQAACSPIDDTADSQLDEVEDEDEDQGGIEVQESGDVSALKGTIAAYTAARTELEALRSEVLEALKRLQNRPGPTREVAEACEGWGVGCMHP